MIKKFILKVSSIETITPLSRSCYPKQIYKSTYPVVVAVTMAHHKPSHMPIQNDGGKCPEFALWSYKQKILAFNRSNPITPNECHAEWKHGDKIVELW